MLKTPLRKYRKFRYDHRYDYPAMFLSIGFAVGLLKLLAVAGLTLVLHKSLLPKIETTYRLSTN